MSTVHTNEARLFTVPPKNMRRSVGLVPLSESLVFNSLLSYRQQRLSTYLRLETVGSSKCRKVPQIARYARAALDWVKPHDPRAFWESIRQLLALDEAG